MTRLILHNNVLALHPTRLIHHDVRHTGQGVVGRQAAEEDAGGAERQSGGRSYPGVQPDLVPHRAPHPLTPDKNVV